MRCLSSSATSTGADVPRERSKCRFRPGDLVTVSTEATRAFAKMWLNSPRMDATREREVMLTADDMCMVINEDVRPELSRGYVIVLAKGQLGWVYEGWLVAL